MNNKEKNFVSAVVYLYNEGNNILSYVSGLEETLKNNFEKYEIIVVNDASTDNSVELVKSYVSSQDGAKVTLMNMGFHQGLETSIGAGVDLAIGDFVLEIESAEADYNWNVMMEVYRHSLEGYDIVNACGKVGKKITAGSIFYKVMNQYANLQYPLTSGSFRIVSRRAINRIHSLATKIPYRKVAYSNCGLKSDIVQYDCIKKINPRRYANRLELASTSLVLFTDLAFRFVFTIAVLASIITTGLVIYGITTFIMNGLINSWTIIVFFICLALSGILTAICIVIRYLSTLVKLNYLKKDYIFESIDKLQK